MNRARSLVSCVCVLLMTPLFAGATELPGDWLESRHASAFTGEFTPVTRDEYESARALFRQVLNDTEPVSLDPQLRALRLVAETQPGFLVISEQVDAQTGRGFFIFRTENYVNTLLQAPHARADLLTGQLTLRWMSSLNFRAAALNTVQRYALDNSASDLARLEYSYFTALAEAAVDVLPEFALLQVHGFASANRTTDAGQLSSVVLSSGRSRPEAAVLARAGCLMALTDVSIYALDITELGGTLNPVGRVMRKRDASGFIHLELETSIRKTMVRDRELSEGFGRCLLNAQP